MMATKEVRNAPLRRLISEEKLLKSMVQLQLVLQLYFEYINRTSYYAPYISTLPETFSMPLFWTVEEMKQLEGSVSVLDDVLTHQIRVIQMYTYVYNLLREKV